MEHDLVGGPEREHITAHQRLGIDQALFRAVLGEVGTSDTKGEAHTAAAWFLLASRMSAAWGFRTALGRETCVPTILRPAVRSRTTVARARNLWNQQPGNESGKPALLNMTTSHSSMLKKATFLVLA